jgi:hypothetical protein
LGVSELLGESSAIGVSTRAAFFFADPKYRPRQSGQRPCVVASVSGWPACSRGRPHQAQTRFMACSVSQILSKYYSLQSFSG